MGCEDEVEGGCEEEDAVLYSAAPPARAIRPYGAGPSSLLIIDWEKNPAHPCPLPSSPGPWGQQQQQQQQQKQQQQQQQQQS